MLIPLLFLACSAVPDWPQFRGPQGNGHATGDHESAAHTSGQTDQVKPPLEWSADKNVAWKVTTPGLGWSSPIVVGNRVYLTTAVPQGEGLSLRALALDTHTGQVVWDREVRAVDKAPAMHAKNSHASPTPIVHENAVYVYFGPLGMARLDAHDGHIRWLSTELPYPPMHGSGGSPVLHDGKLVVVCDGSVDPFVAALQAEDGKVLWKTLRNIKAKINHSFVTPTITTVDGVTQVLAPGPDHMAAYNLADGTELWRVLAPGWSVVPQPVIGPGLVIYNHDYDKPELMAVRLGGMGDITDSHVAWRIKRGAPSTPTPVLVGDELYFVSDAGIASCVDVTTGERHWMERLSGNYSASPIYVDGRILFLSETGLATWIQPSKQFTVLGKNELPGRTLATPAFVGNAMYLRTDTHLYKFVAPE